MHAFDVLGDPVRRRILEILVDSEHASGEVVEVISGSSASPSRRCRSNSRSCGRVGSRRCVPRGRDAHAVDTRPLAEVDAWLEPFRRFWGPRLEALATEIARGKRAAGAVESDAEGELK